MYNLTIFDLSITTLIPIITMGSILSVTIYLLYIFNYHIKDTNIILYIAGKTSQSIAWIIFLLWNMELDSILMLTANIFLFAGSSIEIYSMIRINKRNYKSLKTHLVIITSLAISLYAIFSHDITGRVVVNATFIAIIFSYLFVHFALKKENTRMQIIIGWMALGFASINLLRGVFTITSGVSLPLFSEEPVQILAGLVWVMIAYSFPLFFLFTLKEKDNFILQEAIYTKDKFFKIIAHDLRSPIAQMIQFSILIEQNYHSISEDKMRRFIKALKNNSLNSSKLLDNLLTWSLSQTGGIVFNPTQFTMSEIIDETLYLLKSQAETKDITIVTRDLNPEPIVADKNMLTTILRNLVCNAIKFTPNKGAIEIKTTIRNQELQVSVKDSGVGIAPEKIKTIFNIDPDETSRGTNNEKGTGIGLTLCKDFVDRHKGKIWLESVVNKGSTFYFTIPQIKTQSTGNS